MEQKDEIERINNIIKENVSYSIIFDEIILQSSVGRNFKVCRLVNEFLNDNDSMYNDIKLINYLNRFEVSNIYLELNRDFNNRRILTIIYLNGKSFSNCFHLNSTYCYTMDDALVLITFVFYFINNIDVIHIKWQDFIIVYTREDFSKGYCALLHYFPYMVYNNHAYKRILGEDYTDYQIMTTERNLDGLTDEKEKIFKEAVPYINETNAYFIMIMQELESGRYEPEFVELYHYQLNQLRNINEKIYQSAKTIFNASDFISYKYKFELSKYEPMKNADLDVIMNVEDNEMQQRIEYSTRFVVSLKASKCYELIKNTKLLEGKYNLLLNSPKRHAPRHEYTVEEIKQGMHLFVTSKEDI